MSQYLLDTHTFLWWVDDSLKLSSAARSAISSLENTCYLSMASVWEMAIKLSLGKLKLVPPLKRFIPEQISANDFKILAINFSHISKLEHLPFHHRDPFDRLLVTQAMTEKMAIISADSALACYEVEKIW
ncbi:MAG: type II toxin-antitoxin system VapC family toxin [Desulfopila sp.]